MLKNAVTIALLSGAVISSSFAFNPLHPLKSHSKAATKPAIARNHIQSKQSDYTDFSGTWTGSCVANTEEQLEEYTTVIENDATSITINGQTYSITGGLNTISESDDLWTMFFHVKMNWNPEHTQIIAATTDVTNFHNSQEMESGFGNINISLENGQLIFKGKALTMPEQLLTTYQCSYSKA